jgi:hypothetical protein
VCKGHGCGLLALAPLAVLPLEVTPDLLEVGTNKTQDIRHNFITRVQSHRTAHVESRNHRLISAEHGEIESAEEIFSERFAIATNQGCFVPYALTQNRYTPEFVIERSLGDLDRQFCIAKGFLWECCA